MLISFGRKCSICEKDLFGFYFRLFGKWLCLKCYNKEIKNG